jgi:hypothetical protein
MLKVRAEADDLIEKNPGVTLDLLYSSQPKDSTRSLFVIIRFYEQIWLGILHDRLRKDITRDLFGEIFYWWYEVCFKDLLSPTGWDSWKSISSLKEEFDKNPNTTQKEDWQKRAEGNRQERLQKAPLRSAAAGKHPNKMIVFKPVVKFRFSLVNPDETEAQKKTRKWSDELEYEAFKSMKQDDIEKLLEGAITEYPSS